MTLPNPANKPAASPAGRQFGLLVLVLSGILAALFWRSFVPGQMVFANDGPLGLMVAFASSYFSAFTGHWSDLNWVGSAMPAAIPDITQLLYFILAAPWLKPDGMVLFGKFFAPASLLILGIGAWTLFRTLKFRPAVCIIAAIAAALHTDAFSNACWGLPPWPICHGMVFLALAAVVAANGRYPIAKLVLAGAATGIGIMEAYDTGAIFSLFIAAFTVFLGVTQNKLTAPAAIKSGLKVALVAGVAALVAAAALSTLVGTQIQGITGMGQDQETKQARWYGATLYSMPKTETLRVLVAGLFGYRMDTPEGGAYWGAVGQDLEHGIPSRSGSGEYAGVMVVMLALWAALQSCRKNGSPYGPGEKRMIWFWVGAAVISLLLAFGRHAAFYRLFYLIPYASTMRNPIKFMQPFSVAIGILFAFGLEGMARLYVAPRPPVRAGKGTAKRSPQKTWWQALSNFDHKCLLAMGVAFGVSALCFLIHASAHSRMVSYLQTVGFDAPTAEAIFKFSVKEVGWYLVFLGLSSGLVLIMARGALAGKDATLVWMLLGAVVAADLARANIPWIQYYDYLDRYTSNPILDRLREKPYAQRVQLFPIQINKQMRFLHAIYKGEWAQHQFPYYRIQSLDLTQEPRIPWDNAMFRQQFELEPTTTAHMHLLPRTWELTSTRYILGLSAGGFVEQFNGEFDPGTNRFHLVAPFDLISKQTPPPDPPTAMDFTAVEKPEGPFALIEFTGALPRAGLYSQWQVMTNLEKTLQRLAEPDFNPHQTVLVEQPIPASSAGTNQTAGTVEITSYAHKRIQLKAQAHSPSVLLLNDKFDPAWKVRVDGQLQPMLRCNFLMRGVLLQPGQHTVEFHYEPPTGGLWVSFGAIAVSLACAGFLAIQRRKGDAEPAG